MTQLMRKSKIHIMRENCILYCYFAIPIPQFNRGKAHTKTIYHKRNQNQFKMNGYIRIIWLYIFQLMIGIEKQLNLIV